VPFASWHELYDSAAQQPWALLAATFAFGVWRLAAPPPGPGALPGARPLVIGWSLFFGLETLLDPLATGPLASALGSAPASTVLGVAFVLLGDLRIWWLVFRISSGPRGLPRALAATVAVPIAAWAITTALAPLPDQALWLVHESLFVALAVAVSRRLAGSFERSVLAYAAVYYALWAACDVLILAGVDAGWLLRWAPNQLYYGFTVPFVWWRFFAPSYAATSSSTQASR